MSTDLWIRNPDRAMSALVKQGVTRITWTRQHLMRLRTDGIAIVRGFYLASPLRPKIMTIGIQGAAEYDIFGRIDQPKAVYPVWSGEGDKYADLIKLIENPWGQNSKLCDDDRIISALRPVYGQKHRVIIHNCPSPTSGPGKQFWLSIANTQIDYPDVELFINGTNSFATLFGLNFRAGDFGISDAGDINDRVQLGNGMRIHLKENWERLEQYQDWFKVMGFNVKEVLSSQERRYEFRIASANWASTFWNENFRFFVKSRNIAPDFESADADFVPQQNNKIILRPRQFTLAEADKILCARCRISPGCKFYREDSICGIGDSPMSELAKLFGSRNASRVIDGLGKLVTMQAERLEAGLSKEAEGEELDPQVSKEMNSLFANGVKLAKLLDPNLAGPGTKVQVNVGVNAGTAQAIASADPKQMVASVIDALESQGIPRDKITPQMVQNVLENMSVGSPAQAITAQGEADRAVKASELLQQIQPASNSTIEAEYSENLSGREV